MITKLYAMAALSIVYTVMQFRIRYKFAQVANKATPLISAILFVWAAWITASNALPTNIFA
jgi:hypothetical protein